MVTFSDLLFTGKKLVYLANQDFSYRGFFALDPCLFFDLTWVENGTTV